MKRIKPPHCTACGAPYSLFESAVWPTVRACSSCYHTLICFMLEEGFADSSMFFYDLVSDKDWGTPNSQMPMHDGSQMLLTQESTNYTGPYKTWYVKLPIELESENNLHDELDNLFQV